MNCPAFSNPFCHWSDRNDPKKPAYHAGESNAVYLRAQKRKERESGRESYKTTVN